MPKKPLNFKIDDWIQLIQSQACNGVIILNGRGEIIGFNEKILDIWECSLENITTDGKPIILWDFLKIEFPFSELLGEVKKVGNVHINKVKFFSLKQNEKVAKVSGWVLKQDDDDFITGWLWYDITDFYSSIETAHFEFLKETLNKVFYNAPIMYFLWEVKSDFTTEILGINELSQRELGISASELLGKDFVSFAIPEPWKKPIQKYIRYIYGKLEPYLGNHPIFNKDGEEIYVRWLDVPIKLMDNRVWVVSIGENIHERAKLERRLRESEQRYKRMLEAVTDYVFHVVIHNGEVVETVHSPGCESVTGYTPDDFKKDPYLWLNMVVEEDRRRVIDYANALMRGEPQSPITHRIYRKDGQVRWIRNTSVLIYNENNQVIGYDGIIRDITEEVLAYEKLQKSEELYRNIVEQLVEGYLRIDVTGRISFANQSALEMLGSDVTQTSVSLFDLVVGEDRDKLVSAISRIINRESRAEIVELKLSEKTKLPGNVVECSILPIISISEHIAGFSVLMRNITQRKRELERILDIQKKDSLANLVGGLAHDLNNLLMVMQGHLDLLQAEYYSESLPTTVAEHITGVQESITKAGDLCKQMMLYAGKGVFFNKRRLELNDFIKKILPLINATITRKITLDVNLTNIPLWIDADELLLRQAVLGIIANAVEAIGSKSGRIRIRTSSDFYTEEMLSEFLVDDPKPKTGQYVILEIEDTGCGISSENLEKIFDPFFTTKFLGRGLGLSAIYGIVRKHNGNIKVESEEGKGTKVVVLFPFAIEGFEETKDLKGVFNLESEDEYILLLDDEEHLGLIIERVLKSRGYNVIRKNNVGDFIALLGSGEVSKVKLIILDVNFSEEEIERLLSDICKSGIEIPILLCSGVEEKEISDRYSKLIFAKIRKPFLINEIIEVVDSFWKTLS